MSAQREIVVGVDSEGYRERRNITGLPTKNVRYRRVRGARAPLAFAHYVTYRRPHFALQHHFQDFGLSRADLHHFFFSISFGPKPWIVSFSSWIPRWGKQDRRGLERLADDGCRRLIPISQHAWDVQRHVLQHNADLLPAIEPKVEVIHPAQRPIIADFGEKPGAHDTIDFVFVGKQFFLKGGAAMLRVFTRLLDEGLPLRLHVVSSMQHLDFTTRSTPTDVAAARDLMGRYAGRIVFHGRLPNADVLELLRRSHVALLPTIADTYGYFALEAQAAGCPVITTPVQALAEINNDSCGWLLDVPLNEIGRARRRTEEERAAFDAALEEGLDAAVRDVLARPDQIAIRGRRALARIRDEHDPERTAIRLRAIYDEALAT